MKLNKKLLVMAFAGMSAGAFAQYSSPELALVTDDGGTLANGTTVQAQVERYDPTTGAYLGAFGAGYLHVPTGVTVVGQNAYVTDTWSVNSTLYSKIDEFNFSTGAFVGSIFSPAPYYLTGVALYNGNVLATDLGNTYNADLGSGMYTYNSSGVQTGFVGAPTNNYLESLAVGDNQAYAAAYGGLTAYGLNSNGTASGVNWNVGGNYYYGVGTNQYDPGLVWADGLNSQGVGVIDQYSSTGTLLQEYQETGSAYQGVAFGHGTSMYALNASTDSIERFDTNVSLELGPMGSFALTDTADPLRMAIYAAPEPFSMAGLALGAIGLIARRRRMKA